MARIFKILVWGAGRFTKHILRWVLFSLLFIIVIGAVLVAGLPDQLLTGKKPNTLMLLVAGSVLSIAAFLANLVAGLVSNRIQRWADRRLPAVQEFFRNHDLAELTGQAIGMILAAAAKSAPAEDRGTVEWLAEKAPSAWTRISTSSEVDPAFKSIFERNLTEFVRDPSRHALTPETWKKFIREVADKDPSWSPPTQALVLEALSRRFSEAFREALKHDFVADGHAYAALQLDIATSLLQQVTSAVASIDKAQEGLSEIRQTAFRIERDQFAASEARDRHHREVQARFTHVISGLDRLLNVSQQILVRVEDSHSVLQSTHSDVAFLKEELAGLRAEFRAAILRPQIEADGRVLPSVGTQKDIDGAIDELRVALDRDALVESLRDMTGATATAALDQLIEKRQQARDLVAKSEAKLWRQKGTLSFQTNTSEALSAFQQAVALDASDSAAWRGIGLSFNRLGRLNEALEATGKALELSPGDASCWSARAYVLGSLDRHEEALAAYERALALRPDDVQDWSNKGFELAQVGQVERALEAFEKAVSLNPRSAQAWANKGWAFYRLGKFDAAALASQKAVELEPDFAQAWANLGVILDKRGQTLEALPAFDESINLDTGNWRVWVDKAAMLRKLKQLGEAKVAVKNAIDLSPESSEAWKGKMMILMESEQFGEAVQAGERSIALDPKNASTWFTLGVALGQMGQYEKAAEAFEKSIACNENDADVWVALGEVLILLGRFDKSLEKLTRATELAPDMIEAWVGRGRALGCLGRQDEALQSFDRAATLSAGDVDVWEIKINVLVHFGRFEEALAALSEVAKLNTDARIFVRTDKAIMEVLPLGLEDKADVLRSLLAQGGSIEVHKKFQGDDELVG